jgi:glycosyltransferase involved in cell wall biosynthesis
MKKILWVKSDFLHPTTRGGQIRTLEILRQVHRRHEVHYVAFDDLSSPQGLSRSSEYCSFAYPLRHSVPDKASLTFASQLITGLFSPLPVVVSRYRSAAMREQVRKLTAQHSFDAIVCDFLFPAINLPDLARATLFQHNVEATIWERHSSNASTFAHRLYFGLQARRMLAYEGRVCALVGAVVAVSPNDAQTMRRLYRVSRVCTVPTGVDLDFFAPPPAAPRIADLVFLGSMDWMPNIDGVCWFVRDILPRIRRRRRDCSVAIVGRRPAAAVRRLADRDPAIRVTGTVDDVRPWLWGSRLSIVPLLVGGGTRLKIFEAHAARIPVVSTSVGAEGLDLKHGVHLLIADEPEAFADACLSLLDDDDARRRLADAAWNLVSSSFSWETVSKVFEGCLRL